MVDYCCSVVLLWCLANTERIQKEARREAVNSAATASSASILSQKYQAGCNLAVDARSLLL